MVVHLLGQLAGQLDGLHGRSKRASEQAFDKAPDLTFDVAEDAHGGERRRVAFGSAAALEARPGDCPGGGDYSGEGCRGLCTRPAGAVNKQLGHARGGEPETEPPERERLQPPLLPAMPAPKALRTPSLRPRWPRSAGCARARAGRSAGCSRRPGCAPAAGPPSHRRGGHDRTGGRLETPAGGGWARLRRPARRPGQGRSAPAGRRQAAPGTGGPSSRSDAHIQAPRGRSTPDRPPGRSSRRRARPRRPR